MDLFTRDAFEARELFQDGLGEAPDCSALEPRLMELPGLGEVLVGGEPFELAERLDGLQGDNAYDFSGDCGLVAVRNMLAAGGSEVTEDQVIARALETGKCSYSPLDPPERNGMTNVLGRRDILESYGVEGVVLDSKAAGGSLEALASYVEAGHGASISVNSGYAWDDASYVQDGTSNHCIAVTGTARSPETGKLLGLFVCDSGAPGGDGRCIFMSAERLELSYARVPGSSALVTAEPIR